MHLIKQNVFFDNDPLIIFILFHFKIHQNFLSEFMIIICIFVKGCKQLNSIKTKYLSTRIEKCITYLKLLSHSAYLSCSNVT